MAYFKRPALLFIVYSMFIMAMSSNAQTHEGVEPPHNVQNIFKAKKTVTIINDLGDGLTLQYHCKSKDDDLGDRSLAPGESWPFRFTPAFFGNTLFFCLFSWNGEAHWFDIYKDNRDDVPTQNPCIKCTWQIRKTGPCRFNGKTNNFDICYGWNK